MLRLTRSSGVGRVLRAQARGFAKYESGITPTLYLSPPSGHSVQISESEWVSLLHDVFGVPLTNYYKSRYPQFTQQELEHTREQLRNSFHFGGDWKKAYEKYKLPAEMFQIRARLEAELDPTNAQKLQAALDNADPVTADGFGQLRLKQLQEQQKAEKALSGLNQGSGSLSAPDVDFDYEYSKGGLATATYEKRVRYDRLRSSNLSWDSNLPGKWLSAYKQCAEERQKDIDVDYLRYLEGHIRDQFRAEKWYQRLSEDGEETLTYEEVEAWMPEYTDTLYVDYDQWWELVNRNTENSLWDKFFNTTDQYYNSIKGQADAQKSLSEDNEKVRKHFASSSPFDTFRDVPVFDYNFLAAQTSDPQIKQLCDQINSGAKAIAYAEASGSDASAAYGQTQTAIDQLATILASRGGKAQKKALAAHQ